ARDELGDTVTYGETMHDAVTDANVVVVATAWPEFEALSADMFANSTPKPTLVDCWNLYDANDFAGACIYVALGKG
ncbi:MAG: UDP binding domain-containing protein, partial [Alphaproteobacteria bacterium]